MNLGFVGAGNMAGAIIKGIMGKGAMAAQNVYVYDIDDARVAAMARSLGIVHCASCTELIARCDMILFAVKPYQLGAVIAEHRDELSHKAVISIAAGWTMEMLRNALPAKARALRVMPNTPALVGEGMTVLSRDTSFTDAERNSAEQIFASLGRALWLDEHQIEAAIGVSGSGPAYGYMFIEAMADGGVSLGLTRPQALEMAAQTLLGAAKMALESGFHPGELKDMVCSPGGTTIAAVRSLEGNGLRSAVIEAVVTAAERAREMQK